VERRSRQGPSCTWRCVLVPQHDLVTIESKPSAHLALTSKTVGAKNVAVDAAQFCEAEGAVVYGRFRRKGST